MVVRRTLAGARTAPASVLLLLLMLTGCGGSTSVADPPVSPPPTSTAPHHPKRESPQHFIRRWAAEDTRMQNTGETTPFRAMTTSCEGCDAVVARIAAIYQAGGHIRTRGWSIRRIMGVSRTRDSRTFDLVVDSAPTVYVTRSGAAPSHYSGGRVRFEVRLRPQGNSWEVSRFVQVAT